MREITLKELLELQLNILRDVDAFCRKNNIQYTVDGGTCIGAVRHKGYIPWDDDIDIAMTRPNYEKFINSFNGTYENLEVLAPELDWNYYAPYANVVDKRTILDEGANGHHGMEIGVKIDVFPIDGVATEMCEYHSINKKIHNLWDALYVKRVNLSEIWKNNKRMFFSTVFCRVKYMLKSYASIQKEYYYLVTKYSFETAEYVENLTMPLSRDVRCSKQAFDKYLDMPFENIIVLKFRK